MYGWKARLGLIFPSRGDTFWYEFYKVAPPGVVAVPYILNLKELERSEFNRLRAAYAEAVKQLEWERVDAICVGGTPPFLAEGGEGYSELAEQLRASTSIPLITGPQAEVAALKAGGSNAPTIVTPHEEDLNERLAAFFASNGIFPKSITGLGMRTAFEISLLNERAIYRQVVDMAFRDGVGDAVHFTCSRWPTADILPLLEEVLEVPCTSSAQAKIWASLSMVDMVPESAGKQKGSLYGHKFKID